MNIVAGGKYKRNLNCLSDLAEAQIKADAQSEADLYAPPLVAASSEPEIASSGTATACAVTGNLEVSTVKLSPDIPAER